MWSAEAAECHPGLEVQSRASYPSLKRLANKRAGITYKCCSSRRLSFQYRFLSTHTNKLVGVMWRVLDDSKAVQWSISSNAVANAECILCNISSAECKCLLAKEEMAKGPLCRIEMMWDHALR